MSSRHRTQAAGQLLLAIASRSGGALGYPAALLGRSHSLMTADQERPLHVYAVTLRDRSDGLRAAPGGRQRADSNDCLHSYDPAPPRAWFRSRGCGCSPGDSAASTLIVGPIHVVYEVSLSQGG